MRLSRIAASVFIVCLGTVAPGCGSRTAPPAPYPNRPSPRPDTTVPPADGETRDCRLLPEPGERVRTVALTETVDPANAPYPSNDSERLLFRQLYETLVRIDCDGRAQPGLAASWGLDGGGRFWIVTLREDAHFSDGTPVTTKDVLTSWTLPERGGELRPQVSRHVASIVAVNDRTIGVALRQERADAPWVLAHTDLAIARRAPDLQWPLGTRAVRRTSDGWTADATGISVVTLTRVSADAGAPELADTSPVVRFLAAPDHDPRDLLDEGVDLLVTRDPATLDYAATLRQFVSVPLAWQRTHVLLSPWRLRTSPDLSPDARRDLAADAVRGEARGAGSLDWSGPPPGCEIAALARVNQRTQSTGRIVYEAGDAVARDLAERFVGLAAAGPDAATLLTDLVPGRPSQNYRRASALSGDALAAALGAGADTGYVVSLDQRRLDACENLRALVDRAAWLDPETIVPLVDTRLRALLRRGYSSVTVEWDGGLVITGAEGDR